MSSSWLPASPPTLFPASSANSGSTRGGLGQKASEFESMLLSQWLQSAQSTVGSAPGSEEDDAEAQQWNGFATQQLAQAISARGGIGIGSVVEKALQATEKAHSAAKPEAKAVSR